MGKNILKTKSYAFAVKTVKLSQGLVTGHKEYVNGKQILKRGIAIGALIRETEFAQSRKNFINKMSISLKEVNESAYWIDLLKDTDLWKLRNTVNYYQIVKN